MPSSKLEIVNLALSHIGVGNEVAIFDTEKSEEANCARRFYKISVERTLRDAAWPFATKIAALALIEEEPNTEWGYSYDYPVDCLAFRRVLSGIRLDTRQSKSPYRIAKGPTNKKIIFSDEQDAIAEWTVDVVAQEALFDADFAMAVSLYLAARMAPRLTKGDQFKLGKEAMEQYLVEISVARLNAYNEEQSEEETESEFIRARD